MSSASGVLSACAAVTSTFCHTPSGSRLALGARGCISLIFFLLITAEAPTRSKAAQPYGLARKIASVSRRLLSIMAADVNNWQTIVQA